MKKLLLLSVLSIATAHMYGAARDDGIKLMPSNDPVLGPIVNFVKGLNLWSSAREYFVREIYAATIAPAPATSPELLKKRAQLISRIHTAEQALKSQGKDSDEIASYAIPAIVANINEITTINNYLSKQGY